ncbi:hypothetical protein M0802_010746 [Mischocyttarus mexicanus]|nr:hypothetical protein M0802_010746 [Mischocyttarus mexicanus]
MENLSSLLTESVRYIKKFDPGRKSFLLWQNEFEFVVNLLRVSDDIKAYFLIYMMSFPVRQNIEERIAPYSIFAYSYKRLIYMLEELYSPYRGLDAIIYRFLMRNQMPFESAELYILALIQILSEFNYCFIDKIGLLKRFLEGLKSTLAKCHLNQIRELTLDNAVLIAQHIELYELRKWP